ncbi:MAG: PocR ligand-binding domain-containing protein [Bacteroidota bacterium]|nr:PocR ligand-binding domain-containing protein [Bacteroidota bacterium]
MKLKMTMQYRFLLYAILDNENVPDAIYFKNRESRFIRINRFMANKFNLKEPAEAVGKTDYDFFDANYAEQAFKDEQAIIRTGQPIIEKEEMETWFDRPPTWVLTTKLPLLDKKGTIIGTYGISYDITQRKKAENDLRKTNSLLTSTLESTADGILVIDKDCKVIQFNKKFTELWRIPGATLEDVNDFDHFLSTCRQLVDMEKAQASYLAINAGKETTSDNLFFKDGRIYERYSQPQLYEGEIVGRVWSFRDITERKQMEEAIRKRILSLTLPMNETGVLNFEDIFDLSEVQRTLNEFSEATGVASILTHLDGTPITKPIGFTRFCNEIVRKSTIGCANCYKSDAQLGALHPEGPVVMPCLSGGLWDAGTSIIIGGHHVANWIIGQVRDNTQTDDSMRAYARKIGVDENRLLEAFHEVPSMSEKQFKAVAQIMYTFARQLSTSVYQNFQQARFISEQKRAEAVLHENEARLRELNATKDKFFSIIAHDLKNPFNCILGFSELLEDKIKQNDLTKVDLYASTIKKSCNQAMNLLVNLLDWARTQTGAMKFHPENIDLIQLIHLSIQLLEDAANQKSISIDCDMPQSVILKLDKSMIYTVLRNILANAIKFTHPDGHIFITVKSSEEEWLVSISDNGVGIKKEVLPKLFRIDETVSTEGTNNEQGSGIGLLLCKELIAKHGGDIWAKSEWGKGSTFCFTIPTGTTSN